MKYPICPECGAPPLLTYPTPRCKGVGATWNHAQDCETWSDGMPFTDEPETLKVVINGGFDGFRLSDKAHFELGSLRLNAAFLSYAQWELPVHLRDLDEMDFRSHDDVVAVVEDLGPDDAHSNDGGDLWVVEVPIEFADDIHIAEYDGKEWVAQNHRTWR